MSEPDMRMAAETMLQPGEWFADAAPHRVRTLLGSCIAITMWHPDRRVGAMCHFLLPSRGGPQGRERDARFGDEALSLMLERLGAMGVDPRQCQAKIFGGGNMFPRQFGDGVVTIGQQNGEAAHRLLDALHIEVVSQSLYGIGHRQIIFDVATGAVWVRHVKVDTDEPDGIGAAA